MTDTTLDSRESSTAATGRWRLGPEHPQYGYSDGDGDYENGSMMARRFFLTPEGRAVSSVVQTIVSAQRLVPSADPAPSGHHIDREWVDAMKRRATRLGNPHGADCPCLMCADVRIGEAAP